VAAGTGRVVFLYFGWIEDVERVSTVGYCVIKYCLIDFITEQGESWCSVCAVTMLNSSADKGLKAIPICDVSETPPGAAYVTLAAQAGAAYVTLASTVDWNTVCRAGCGMPWLLSPYRTRAQPVIILSMWVVTI